MDIGLEINGVPVRLGMNLVPENLQLGSITKKKGIIGNVIVRLACGFGDDIYWSKNPTARFFGKESPVEMFPSLSPLYARTPDMIWGTTSYLFFKGGTLHRVRCQIIYSQTAATQLTRLFRESASRLLGEPMSVNPVEVSYQTRILGTSTQYLDCIWTDDHHTLISHLWPNGKKASVTWLKHTGRRA